MSTPTLEEFERQVAAYDDLQNFLDETKDRERWEDALYATQEGKLGPITAAELSTKFVELGGIGDEVLAQEYLGKVETLTLTPLQETFEMVMYRPADLQEIVEESWKPFETRIKQAQSDGEEIAKEDISGLTLDMYQRINAKASAEAKRQVKAYLEEQGPSLGWSPKQKNRLENEVEHALTAFYLGGVSRMFQRASEGQDAIAPLFDPETFQQDVFIKEDKAREVFESVFNNQKPELKKESARYQKQYQNLVMGYSGWQMSQGNPNWLNPKMPLIAQPPDMMYHSYDGINQFRRISSLFDSMVEEQLAKEGYKKGSEGYSGARPGAEKRLRQLIKSEEKTRNKLLDAQYDLIRKELLAKEDALGTGTIGGFEFSKAILEDMSFTTDELVSKISDPQAQGEASRTYKALNKSREQLLKQLKDDKQALNLVFGYVSENADELYNARTEQMEPTDLGSLYSLGQEIERQYKFLIDMKSTAERFPDMGASVSKEQLDYIKAVEHLGLQNPYLREINMKRRIGEGEEFTSEQLMEIAQEAPSMEGVLEARLEELADRYYQLRAIGEFIEITANNPNVWADGYDRMDIMDLGIYDVSFSTDYIREKDFELFGYYPNTSPKDNVELGYPKKYDLFGYLLVGGDTEREDEFTPVVKSYDWGNAYGPQAGSIKKAIEQYQKTWQENILLHDPKEKLTKLINENLEEDTDFLPNVYSKAERKVGQDAVTAQSMVVFTQGNIFMLLQQIQAKEEEGEDTSKDRELLAQQEAELALRMDHEKFINEYFTRGLVHNTLDIASLGILAGVDASWQGVGVSDFFPNMSDKFDAEVVRIRTEVIEELNQGGRFSYNEYSDAVIEETDKRIKEELASKKFRLATQTGEENPERKFFRAYYNAGYNYERIQTDLRVLKTRQKSFEQVFAQGSPFAQPGTVVFAGAIDLHGVEGLLESPYYAEMKWQHIPTYFQPYFDGKTDETLEEIINRGGHLKQYAELTRDASQLWGASKEQTFMTNMQSGMEWLSNDAQVDPISGEMYLRTDGSFAFTMNTLFAYAPELYAEIPVAVPIPFLTQAGWLYGGGWGDVPEYLTRRRLELQRTGGGFRDINGRPTHPLLMLGLFDDQVGEELLAYVQERYQEDYPEEEVGLLDEAADAALYATREILLQGPERKAGMTYADLLQYTKDFIKSKEGEDGYWEAGKLEVLEEWGYVDSVYSIYGKGLATALTNRESGIGAVIGPPAGVEKHLSTVMPDIYTPIRNLDLDWTDRFADSIMYMDGGFMSYSDIASNLGYTTGSVQTSWANTGRYLDTAIDFEGMLLSGGLGAGKMALSPLKVGVQKLRGKGLYADIGYGTATRLEVRKAFVEWDPFYLGALYQVVDGGIAEYGVTPTSSVKNLLKDDDLWDQAIEATTTEIPSFEEGVSLASRTVAETLTAGAAGLVLGGVEGAILSMIRPDHNAAVSRTFFGVMGLTPLKGFPAMAHYYRVNARFEKQISDLTYRDNAQSIKRGENPLVAYLTPSSVRAGNFERSDMLQGNLARSGITMADAAVILQDQGLKNKTTLEDLTKALLHSDKVFAENFSRLLKEAGYDGITPEGVLGVGWQLVNDPKYNKGYKRAAKDLTALANKTQLRITQGDIEYTLAKYTIMALSKSGGDVAAAAKFFDNLRFVDTKKLSPIDTEALAADFPEEGVSRTKAREIVENLSTYNDEAYLKSIGLFDYLKGEGRVSLQEIFDFVKDAESKYTFRDNVDPDERLIIDQSKYNQPSDKMDDYSAADVISPETITRVYYIKKGTVLTVGEVHVHVKNQAKRRIMGAADIDEATVRADALKILFREKMKENARSAKWSTDEAFYQVKQTEKNNIIIGEAKAKFDTQVHDYFDGLVKEPSKRKKTQRQVGKEVSDSLQDYHNIRTPQKAGSISAKTDILELDFAEGLDEAGIQRGELIRSLKDSSSNLEGAKESLRVISELDAEKLMAGLREVTDFEGVKAFIRENFRLFGTTETRNKTIAKYEARMREVGPDLTDPQIEAKIKEAEGRLNELLEDDRPLEEKQKHITKVDREIASLKQKKAEVYPAKDTALEEIKTEVANSIDSRITEKKKEVRKYMTETEKTIQELREVGEAIDPELDAIAGEYLKDLLKAPQDFKPLREPKVEDITDSGIDFESGELAVKTNGTGANKMKRGLLPSEIIIERGASSLTFKRLNVGKDGSAFILESVSTPTMSPKAQPHTGYLKFKMAKAIPDKKLRKQKIREARNEIERARIELANNPPDELGDVIGEPRQALRQMLQDTENLPDYIGYQADNLAYGSAIRRELKGIDFQEVKVEDKNGIPYRLIALTDLAKNKIAREGFPVIEDDLMSSIGKRLQRLLDAGRLDDPNAGIATKRWLGLAIDETDLDVLQDAALRETEQMARMQEDLFAGFTREELVERLDEGEMPDIVASSLRKYLDETVTTGNFAFISRTGEETRFSIFPSRSVFGLDDNVDEILVIEGPDLTESHVRNIVYNAAQEGYKEVRFLGNEQPKMDAINSLELSWDAEVTLDTRNVEYVGIKINQDMRDSVPVRSSPLFAKKDATDITSLIHGSYGGDRAAQDQLSSREKRIMAGNASYHNFKVYSPDFIVEGWAITKKDGKWRIKEGTKYTSRKRYDTKEEAIEALKYQVLLDPSSETMVGALPIVRTKEATVKALHQEVLPHSVVLTADGKVARQYAEKTKAALKTRQMQRDPTAYYLEDATIILNHPNGLFVSNSELELMRRSKLKEMVITTPTREITISGTFEGLDEFLYLNELMEADLTDPEVRELYPDGVRDLRDFQEKLVGELPTETPDAAPFLMLDAVHKLQDLLAEELTKTGTVNVTIKEHNFTDKAGTYELKPAGFKTGSLHFDTEYKLADFTFSRRTVDSEAREARKARKQQIRDQFQGKEQLAIILKRESAILEQIRSAYLTRNFRNFNYITAVDLEQFLNIAGIDSIPDFIQTIVENVQKNFERLKEGRLTYADAFMAYFMSVSSQQAKEVKLDVLKKLLQERDKGESLSVLLSQTLSRTEGTDFSFITTREEVAYVRQEDLAGAWFMTPKGRGFLEELEAMADAAKQERSYLYTPPEGKAKVFEEDLRKVAKDRGLEDLSIEELVKYDDWTDQDLLRLHRLAIPALPDPKLMKKIKKSSVVELELPERKLVVKRGVREWAGRIKTQDIGISSEISDLYAIRSVHPTAVNNLRRYLRRGKELEGVMRKRTSEESNEFAKIDKRLKQIEKEKLAIYDEFGYVINGKIVGPEKWEFKFNEIGLASDEFGKLEREVAILETALAEQDSKRLKADIFFDSIDTHRLLVDIIITTDRINELGRRYTGPDKEYAKEFFQATREMRGIGDVKAPFMAQLLGYGAMTTVDAQEQLALLGLWPGKELTPSTRENKKIRRFITDFANAGKGTTIDGRTIGEVYQEAVMERYTAIKNTLAKKDIVLPEDHYPAIIHQWVWALMKKYTPEEIAQTAMYAPWYEKNIPIIPTKTIDIYVGQIATNPTGMTMAAEMLYNHLFLEPDALEPHAGRLLHVLDQVPHATAVTLSAFIRREFPDAKFEEAKHGAKINVEVSGYSTELNVKQDLAQLTTKELYQEKDGEIRGSFENTGEVVRISLSEAADFETLLHETAHHLEDMMPDNVYQQLAQRYHSEELDDGRLVMSRRGREDFVRDYIHVHENRSGIGDSRLKSMMDRVKETFARFQLIKLKNSSRNTSRTPPSLAEKMLIQQTQPFQLLRRDAQVIAEPYIKDPKRAEEASALVDRAIVNDTVQGLLESSEQQAIPFRKAFLFTGELNLPEGPLQDAVANKESKAVAKVRSRMKKQGLEDLKWDLRPSQYPGVFDKTKLIPERRRAKENLARERMQREGIEETPELLEEYMEQAPIRPKHIDEAYFQLIMEDKPIDIADYILRNMSLVEYRRAQHQTNLKYISMTSRTIVQERDRELYATVAKNEMERLFGEDMTRVANKMRESDKDRLDVTGKDETLINIKGKTLNEVTHLIQPYGFFGADVKARLQTHVSRVQSTPGMHTLPGDLVQRIESSGPDVQLYIDDIPYIRDSVIDMTSPVSYRRESSLETANANPIYNLLSYVGLSDGKIEGLVRAIFEDYNPSLLESPFQRVEELDPRINDLIRQLEQELRSLGTDIERILSLLKSENSRQAIKQARERLGSSWTDKNQSRIRDIGPGMFEIIRQLRRMLNPPVDSVHVHALGRIQAELNGIKQGVVVPTRGELFRRNISDKSKRMKEITAVLDAENINYSAEMEVIGKWIKKEEASEYDKKQAMTKAESDELELAINRLNQKYSYATSRRDPLTIGSWKDTFNEDGDLVKRGLLKELEVMFGGTMTTDELMAFETMREFLNEHVEGSTLTDEQLATVRTNYSILFEGVDRRMYQVEHQGKMFYQSITGKRVTDDPEQVDAQTARTAYTLFYQGRVMPGDYDLKLLDQGDRYSLDAPQNGEKWSVVDLVEIHKQHGFRKTETNVSVREDLEKRIGKSLDSLTEDEIVDAANMIRKSPTTGHQQSLFQLALNKGDIAKLTGKVENDLGKISLEMIVRLMAEEKLSNVAEQIAQFHIYGDLIQTSREKMVELGIKPIENEEKFLKDVQHHLNRWMTDGAFEKILTYHDGGRTLDTVTHTDVERSAIQVAEEIINNYGIRPGGGRSIEEFQAPDGRRYYVPPALKQHIEDIVNDITPVGVAKDRNVVSVSEIMERKHNTNRLSRSFARAEVIADVLAEGLIKKGFDPKEAGEIARIYLAETHPEYPKVKEAMKSKEAEANELIKGMGVTVTEEVDKYFQKTLGTQLPTLRARGLADELVFFLNAEKEMAEALLISEHIKEMKPAQIKELGLSPEMEQTVYKLVEDEDGRKSAEQMGVVIQALAKLYPDTVVQVLSNGVANAFKGQGVSTVENTINNVHRLKKRAVTTGMLIPTLAYYVNNAFGAFFQAYLEGGIRGISSMAGAAAAHPLMFRRTMGYLHSGSIWGRKAGQGYDSGLTRDWGSDVFVTRDGRIYTSESLASAAEKAGIGGSFIKSEIGSELVDDIRKNEPFRMWKILAAPKALMDMMTEFANTTDNFFRVSKFMDLLDRGFSEAEAGKIVRDTFFDYAQLTKFEKKYLRNIFLFYAFMRKNQIQVFKAMRDNPGRIGNTFRFIRNSQEQALSDEEERLLLREYMHGRIMASPGFPREMLASSLNRGQYNDPNIQRWFSIEDKYTYKDKYGSVVYIFPNIGLYDAMPMMAPAWMVIAQGLEAVTSDGRTWNEVAQTAWRQSIETGRWALGQTTPFIKMPLEGLTGVFLFNERDLSSITVTQSQLDLINAYIPMFRVNAFNEGYINLKPRDRKYVDLVRGDEPEYVPASGWDVAKMYVMVELMGTLPVANLALGRPRKQTSITLKMMDSYFMGEEFDHSRTLEWWEETLPLISVTPKTLPATEQVQKGAIRDMTRELMKPENR